MATETSTLGTDFARALAAKDHERMGELLHPEIDFRAMTPRKVWEAQTPEAIIGEVFSEWFEDSDEIEELVHLETDAFADRERVGYRFRVSNPEGTHVVDQQAYLSPRDGKIGWLRIMCAGYRPVG
jgi:hypothetical protein